MIKAKLSESVAINRGAPWPKIDSNEIQSYKDQYSRGINSHIYVLPNPILISTQKPSDIITIKRGGGTTRIYPPFPLNEKSEASGAFEGINIPVGKDNITGIMDISSTAILGLRSELGDGESTTWCRGIRVDFENGGQPYPEVRLLVDHICQYTHQWWLRATHNPMFGPLRMGIEITNDFKILPELRYQGAGDLDSHWYGISQQQMTLGFGSPLTNSIWLLAGHHAQENRQADQGLFSFYDGMASYMAGDQSKAILNLCIAAEIIISKHYSVIEKRDPPKLSTAIRDTKLVDSNNRHILRSLASDRNDVAHGREPRNVKAGNKSNIEEYIIVIENLINNYLHSMPAGDWPRIMNTRLYKK